MSNEQDYADKAEGSISTTWKATLGGGVRSPGGGWEPGVAVGIAVTW